ncbi:uncharacterized protein LOC116166995 [Photinus pyralis]|uniref:uncharacterized protein LOC116166995 n=1 Tax=Photinus pyralis TaxID=7054 RepID=UPI00126710F1|nr:uncharacterized protein LOC116166995 [Photinus pyralis]
MILLYFSVCILLPSSLVLFTNGQHSSVREASPNSMVYLNMLQALQKAILDVYQDSATSSTNTQSLELPKMDTKHYDEIARKIKEFNNLGYSELDTYNNAFKQTTIPSLSSVMNTAPSIAPFVPTVFSNGVGSLGSVAPQYSTLTSTYPNTYTTLPQIPQYGNIGAMQGNMGLNAMSPQPYTDVNSLQTGSLSGMNQFGGSGLYGNRNIGMGFNSYSANNLQPLGNQFNSPLYNFDNYPSYGGSGNTLLGDNNYGAMYTPREFLSAPSAGPLSAASELSPSYAEPPRYGEPLWGSSSRYNRGQRAAMYEQGGPFRHTARANLRNRIHNVKRIKSRYAPSYQVSKEKPSSKPKYLIIKSSS